MDAMQVCSGRQAELLLAIPACLNFSRVKTVDVCLTADRTYGTVGPPDSVESSFTDRISWKLSINTPSGQSEIQRNPVYPFMGFICERVKRHTGAISQPPHADE